MKTIEAWLEQQWTQYHLVVIVVTTLAGLGLLAWSAYRARKDSARLKAWMVWLGTNMALIFNAEGTWHILTTKLHQTPEFSVLVFAVFEFALLRAMSLAGDRYRATTERDDKGKVTKPGHPGKAMQVVWFIALSSGVIVASNAPTHTEQLLRIVLPVIVVLLWWTQLTAEGQATRRGRFAYSPSRLATRWGWLVDDEDEDLARAQARRRQRLLVVYGHRLEAKVVGAWWHEWRLTRLAREATEGDVTAAVEQLDRVTAIMDRVVPRLRKPTAAGSPERAETGHSGGQPGTLPGAGQSGQAGSHPAGQPEPTPQPLPVPAARINGHQLGGHTPDDEAGAGQPERLGREAALERYADQLVDEWRAVEDGKGITVHRVRTVTGLGARPGGWVHAQVKARVEKLDQELAEELARSAEQ